MRRARHTDANHATIRETLRACMCVVEDLSDVGRGIPDLLVKTPRGTVLLVEVKNPAQPASKRRLSADEALVAARWGESYRVVQTADDAIALARS